MQSLGAAARRLYVRRWVSTLNRTVGFTGMEGLRDPHDWRKLADRTEETCRGLVDDVIVGTEAGPEVVRGLDYISDVLCQTIDAAEFCRHVHADDEWRQEAHRTCIRLGAYVHELNTHAGLYGILCRSLKQRSSFRVEEEYLVGEMLKRDFERFGVHLQGQARDEMTQLVAFIQECGHSYMKHAIDISKTGEINVDIKKFLEEKNRFLPGRCRDYPLESIFGRRRGNMMVAHGDTQTCQGILYHCDYEEIRRSAFKAYQSYPSENKRLGEDLLKARYRVAEIMGYPSYTAYQLDGFSLGNTPHAVSKFLKSIQNSLGSAVAVEMDELRRFKSSLYKSEGQMPPELHLWDRDWAIQRTMPSSITASLQKLHSIFNVQGFITGMSALVEKVMGLQLVIVHMPAGESWAQGVMKVCVTDVQSGEKFGTIYLDLLQRRGKFGGAALFTLRCGRLLDNGSYQLPKVALVANIASNSFLTFGDLETLCHEFGHALHSVLSRTRLQHLSGTRGPQDIIEVPSHVFERFASDPAALSFMAKWGLAGHQEISKDILTGLKQRREHYAAIKLKKTVEMCILDQYMHGEGVSREGFGSFSDLSEHMKEFGVTNYQNSMFPPVRFSHIVGYGGNYYSYLFANCIASEIWENAQSTSDVGWPSRIVLHHKMLRSGGAKPAQQYIEDILGPQYDSKLVNISDDYGMHGSYPDCTAYLKYLGITPS
jgi:mitochondrial intermediate peptidase